MKLSEIKTSEGRLAIIGNIVAIYAAAQGFIPPDLAAKIGGALGIAYVVARALVKFGEVLAPLTKTDKDDRILAEAEAILGAVPAPKAAEPK